MQKVFSLRCIMLIVVSFITSKVMFCQTGEGVKQNQNVQTAQSDSLAKIGFKHAMEVFEPAMNAQDGGKKIDYKPLRNAMDEFWKQFPNSRRAATILTFYMDMFAKDFPEKVLDEWASFTECKSPVAAELAQGKVRFDKLSTHPIVINVKAIDGRKIDLSALKGKVVLIDFWATWCKPCIKQLPFVKQLYDTYNQQGFEVIGVSLDRDEDKQELLDFIKKNEIKWPQHFGKAWRNEIVLRYAINSIPTTFLLDKDGKLAALNLEGKALEEGVKKLLKK